ncbi:MAG: CapA family protein [Chloroflexi bacterium]|nr:CapA family protein [Chloroflexota bacterium]
MEKLNLYAVGDVTPDHPTPEFLFELAKPTLKQADILFGHLEVNLSQSGRPQDLKPEPHGAAKPDAGMTHTGSRGIPPERVSGLTYAGFSVMSFASNHTLNRGEQPFLETIDTLVKNNIASVRAQTPSPDSHYAWMRKDFGSRSLNLIRALGVSKYRLC